MTKLFEKAIRNKFRYNYKGVLTTEDLWDLDLTELDSIFKDLNSKLKVESEESLLKTKTFKNEQLEEKIEIIKHIVKVKLEEKELAANKHKTEQERNRILEVLYDKQDEELKNMTQEELMAKLNSL